MLENLSATSNLNFTPNSQSSLLAVTLCVFTSHHPFEIRRRGDGDNKSIEIDHHLYEFGSVEYNIQSSASDTHYIYSSVSIPLLSQGVMLPYGISHNTKQMVKGIRPDVVEIIEPAKEGYQLTLRLDFSKISNGKDSAKVIAEIAAVQAVIPQKVIALFPIRFKGKIDVIIVTAFFQELMDVGSSEKWRKAGGTFEDLRTYRGFVSFGIFLDSNLSTKNFFMSCRRKRLDKTVWSLLNFYLCYIPCKGCMNMGELIKISKPTVLQRRYEDLSMKNKRIRCRLKFMVSGNFIDDC
ncbi:actin-related protein 2/3 complex subunit 2B [Pyrus ussuriensis x Pyrus communis]|uniref:Actin-related protein 2/3 complex subunit 2B n=1 Tax=Pyrus ussuriensis x Pyrus communis TaxID=2448454 RepID=A0A5N5F9Y6_9ROSA|nr:actin-related protein 2/3 complex subunit 2B [Pyrus ussuriensis x Pyrus communis]